jgi:hypothetical protein
LNFQTQDSLRGIHVGNRDVCSSEFAMNRLVCVLVLSSQIHSGFRWLNFEAASMNDLCMNHLCVLPAA